MVRPVFQVRTLAATALAVPVLIVLGATSPAAAGAAACTTSWKGGAGSWEDADRWSAGAVPGTEDVVCIEDGSTGVAPVVTVTRDETVARLVTTGATLRPSGGVLVNVRGFDLDDSTVTGPGRLAAQRALTPSQSNTVMSYLSDVTVSDHGRLGLRDRLLTVSGVTGLSGGSTLDLVSQALDKRQVTFADAARVVDLDGDVGNQVLVSGLLGADGAARIEVSTVATDSLTISSGELAILRLNWLRPGGLLAGTAGAGGLLSVGTFGGSATLVLGRDIWGIDPRFTLEIRGDSVIRAGDGTEALAGLRRVKGFLNGFGDRQLAVAGRLRIDAGAQVVVDDLAASAIDVAGGLSAGRIETSRLTGVRRSM